MNLIIFFVAIFTSLVVAGISLTALAVVVLITGMFIRWGHGRLVGHDTVYELTWLISHRQHLISGFGTMLRTGSFFLCNLKLSTACSNKNDGLL